ncbi:translation initiation factor IF-3 [Stratiformator vulcanicus]|uniref:Translation initiation factor IF-3 n=1 Tax=Stratiformator vulcanicus TaxID=2527980 RepID=A0A517R4J1_9PLAN|nr:translation initiation factor IF-3 [Stratiformator vulcanicus]QDT38798.1 Translation initiation factor IF-3 [Stratiformator vulcanicus]
MSKGTQENQGQRLNDQIRITPVRVVDQDGEMLGVIPTEDALQRAQDAGLDLVEVAPAERPPVCRIMDFGKFKYQQKKRLQKGKTTHHGQIKEIRLRPKTGQADIDVRLKRAVKFLEDRDKVKITIMFRGRENAHHDLGRDILLGLIEQLNTVAKVEKPPGMEGGRMMSTVLAPKN